MKKATTSSNTEESKEEKGFKFIGVDDVNMDHDYLQQNPFMHMVTQRR